VLVVRDEDCLGDILSAYGADTLTREENRIELRRAGGSYCALEKRPIQDRVIVQVIGEKGGGCA